MTTKKKAPRRRRKNPVRAAKTFAVDQVRQDQLARTGGPPEETA